MRFLKRRNLFYLSLILSLGLLVSCLDEIENQLIFWPEHYDWRNPSDFGADYETLELKASDGIGLVAWLVPFAEDAPWLIYFHGNNNNISGSLRYPMLLRERLGVNVLMAEYRGFYKSEGTPSEAGLYLDARAYYDYLLAQGVAASEVILYGFSLGSGPAVQLATDVDAAALILQAPFSSVLDTARWRYNQNFPEGFLKNEFKNKEKIKAIDMPLLVLHGTEDTSIPFEQGQALFELANLPKAFIEFPAGHSTLNFRQLEELDFVAEGIAAFVAIHVEK